VLNDDFGLALAVHFFSCMKKRAWMAALIGVGMARFAAGFPYGRFRPSGRAADLVVEPGRWRI